MKTMPLLWMLVIAALLAAPVYAEVTTMEPLVVTATRVATPLSEIGRTVTLIDKDEIESRQAVHLLDVLRGVAGLDVVRQGGSGQQASVFLRGANSAHTLVLIDGIEVNDPSDPARAFDFASLAVENIEQIEIVRGPGSTLYGSDAMGGVINIITRKGQGRLQSTLAAEAGSFATHQEKFAVRGATERVNYSVAGSYRNAQGISAAGKKYGNSEKDGDERKSFSGRVGVTPTNALSLDLFYRYLAADTDLDNSGGSGGDDPNYTSEVSSNFFRAQAQLALFDHYWQQSLGFSLTDADRSYQNATDAAHPQDSMQSRYESQLTKVDWQHNLNLSQINRLTLGVEYEEESAKSRYASDSMWGPYTDVFSKKTTNTAGYYVQDQLWVGEDFVATAGLRLDDHSRFGTEDTYQLSASYALPVTKTRLKASYGTGFKAPSLFELYSSYGDVSLDPETSSGWDAGLEQRLWDDRLLLGATYFSNDFKNLIDFDTLASLYQNIGKAETSGVELRVMLQPVEALTLSAGYTYTKTENRVTGEALLRRPRIKYNLQANYQLSDKGNVNFDILHVGERKDFAFDFSGKTTLKPYTIVNLAVAYAVTEHVRLNGRIENLFDTNYEEVSGYGTPGIAAYLGASLSF